MNAAGAVCFDEFLTIYFMSRDTPAREMTPRLVTLCLSFTRLFHLSLRRVSRYTFYWAERGKVGLDDSLYSDRYRRR